MCAVIQVADLQYETFEVIEEESFDRLATRQRANQLEYCWEQDAVEVPDFELSQGQLPYKASSIGDGSFETGSSSIAGATFR